jgi:hypothetical protein
VLLPALRVAHADGQAAHPRRGAKDRGEYRQACQSYCGEHMSGYGAIGGEECSWDNRLAVSVTMSSTDGLGVPVPLLWHQRDQVLDAIVEVQRR